MFDDAEHRELARVAAGTASRHRSAFSEALWRDLGAAGVLALATPEGGGRVTHVATAFEALGSELCPGPLVPALLAAHLLDGDERAGVHAGERVATVAMAGDETLAWGAVADVLVVIDGTGAWLAEPSAGLEPVSTIAGEPWARGELRRVRSLGDPSGVLALGDVAVAAWIVGAAGALLARAADHAAHRHQFGRPIGDFQAVAHQLASCDAAVASAQALVRLTATRMGADGSGDGDQLAAAARLAAVRAGLDTAYAAHQVFGAIGYTVEAGVGRWSTAIRQATLLPPGMDRAVTMLAQAPRPASFFIQPFVAKQPFVEKQGAQP